MAVQELEVNPQSGKEKKGCSALQHHGLIQACKDTQHLQSPVLILGVCAEFFQERPLVDSPNSK